MEIILLERVGKLGGIGDIVKVKDGYARNFLIPTGKALRANKMAIERFEKDRAAIEAENQRKRADAEAALDGINGKRAVIIRQASEGAQLYGSVVAKDIVEAFAADGVSIDRRQVHLDTTIKTLGIYNVQVVLHPEVTADISINVARSLEEAEIQAGEREAPVEEEGFTMEHFDGELESLNDDDDSEDDAGLDLSQY